MKIKVHLYSWKGYLQGTKHNYVKIFKDGKLIEEQGSTSDRLTFWTPKQAQDYAEKYVK